MRSFRRLRLTRLASPVRWMILVGAVLFLLVRLGDLVLLGPIAAVAEVEARRIGVEAVNQVVTEKVGQVLRHENLVEYEKDDAGRIAAYRVNTPLINQVAAGAAQAVQSQMKQLAEEPFGVPVGALTGSTLMGTSGPRLPVRLVPIGTVAVDIKQEFKGEGINQTRHRIWLEATAVIRVVLPMTTREVEVVQSLPLSETVIVGPVPNSFYNGNLGGVSLPLNR
ncbi:MAG: sporulation protein YunB [Bacillota bacterium]